MPYLGVAPNPRENREVDDISSGFNGGTTQFTLQSGGSNVSPGSDTAIIVSLGGVVQNPGTDYTIAASTITFTTAPASGLSFFGVVLAQSVDIETPADGTVTTSKIVDGAVTNAKVNASAAIAGTKISPDFGSQNIATTGSATIGSDLIHAGDTDTKISFGTDTISLTTNNVTRMTFTGNFIDLPDAGTLRLGNSNDLRISHGSGGASNIVHSNTSQPLNISATGAGNIAFLTNSNERMRIDSSGNVGIGTTNPSAKLSVVDDSGITIEATTNSTDGKMTIIGKNGNGQVSAITRIQSSPESNSNAATSTKILNRDSSNNVNEHMRIDSSGRVFVGTTTTTPHNDGSGILIHPTQGVIVGVKDTHAGIFARHDSDGECIRFQRATADVGSIDVSSSSTSYNTSSDYRLKENVVAISDGITRLKTLKPSRFNFKVDKDTTVDGFLAHEVTAVPEAITGTKDEVDENNEPVYQGIDQSKLVPLLTAALQEAITKIETLETEVAALKAA